MPPVPIHQRYANLEEAGMEPLSNMQNRALKTRLENELYDHFGIWLDESKNVPMSAYLVPRIFVMGKDDKGRDFPRDVNSLKGTELEFGSPGFFQQIQLGNVFAYPTGQEHPVQLSLRFSSSGSPYLNSSEPVTPEALPMPPVKRPRFFGWKKFWNRVTGGRAFKEVKKYETALREHEDAKAKLADNAVGRSEILEKEKENLEKEKKRRVLAAELEAAEKRFKADEVGKTNFNSIFQPVPEKREDLLKRGSVHPAGMAYGYAQEEDFRDLTFLTDDEAGVKQMLEQKDNELQESYRKKAIERGNNPDPKLLHPDHYANGKKYQFKTFHMKDVKPGGKPLTNSQFSAVALAAGLQTKYVYESAKNLSNDFDPTLKNALQECGCSEEDATYISSVNARNIGTTDLFMSPPRDNEGTAIKYMVNPGRLEAAEAFEQYRQNNKAPLAKLIACGVNSFAMEHASFVEEFGEQMRGVMNMSEELIGLMKQDPSLLELARKEGMKPERLHNLEGMLKIYDLDKKARLAEYELAKARLQGEEPTREQKAEYAKHYVMHKLTTGMLYQANKDLEADPKSKYNAFSSEGRFTADPQEVVQGMKIPMPKDRWGEFPPPKGKVYDGSYSAVKAGLHALYDPMPKIADQMNDPKEYRKLEELAEKIVRQEGLAEMSADELFKQINHKNPQLDIRKGLERAAPQPAPVRQEHQAAPLQQQVQPGLQMKRPKPQNLPQQNPPQQPKVPNGPKGPGLQA